MNILQSRGLAVGLVWGLACAAPLVLTGCSTDAPGIKSNYVQQWTLVEGNVEAATDAAEQVLGEYELKAIETDHTQLDGTAVGRMANDTEVKIEVRKVTDESSEVTVRVGTAGDENLGVEIAEKIRRSLD